MSTEIFEYLALVMEAIYICFTVEGVKQRFTRLVMGGGKFIIGRQIEQIQVCILDLYQ